MSPCLVFAFLFFPLASSFECWSCNAEAGSDDTRECIERLEECPQGVESCSTVSYVTREDQRLHIRKFCTSPGTPIYQYLLFFPGSALCQNIETSNESQHFGGTVPTVDDELGIIGGPKPPAPPTARRTVDSDSAVVFRSKRVKRSSMGGEPPAPPNAHQSSLLCVCSKEKCNAGSPEEILERSMLRSLPKQMRSHFKKRTDDGI